MTVLVVISFIIAFPIWLYEIRNESEEDKAKKAWLFNHGLY